MLQRLRHFIQPSHVRDFDPLAPSAPANGWLALEPRILLDGAAAETASAAFDPARSPVIDLNGPTESGRDLTVAYPDREVSTELAAADAFIADDQGDIVRVDISVTGDLIEDMDAVRVGDRIINFSRSASFDDVIAGSSLVDVTYDASTKVMTIADADGLALSAADLTSLLRGMQYGNLSLDARSGTIDFGFVLTDAEGATSAATSVTMVIESDGANPYALLDPDGDNSSEGLFRTTFREADGIGIAIADDDITIVNRDGDPIRQVYITLSNPQQGDALRIQVPSDIEGITANVRTLSDGSIRVTILTSSQAAGENYEALARVISSVRFTNDSEDPSEITRLVSVRLQEGSTFGTPTRLRLDVVGQNDAPTLDLEQGDVTEFGPDYATTWREDGPGVAIISVGSSDIEDVDDEVLVGGRVVNANAEAGDILYLETGLPPGITANISADASTIDFEGEASIAAYRQALETVRFAADPQDPTPGTRTVRVTLNDGMADSNTATALVSVAAENDPPVVTAGPLDDLQRGEDSSDLAFVEAALNFRDVDDDDLRYELGPSAPAWLSIDSATGRITGRPDADASQVVDPDTGRQGRYEVRVRATDPQGAFAETSVVYQIENPAPIARDDAANANDGGPRVTGSVLSGAGADSDPDGDALSVGLVEDSAANVGEVVPGSTGGTFVVEANGDYTFDPGRDFLSLTPGETATTSITYRVSDGQGGFDTAALVMTVIGTNNAPVAQDDMLSARADRPISGNLTIDNGNGVDSDPDGDRITVARLNGATYTPGERTALPSGASLTVRLDGSYTYDPGRAFETLAAGEVATDTFTYTVRDPFGVSSEASVVVSVEGTNERPIPLDPRQPTIVPVGPDNPDAPPTDPDDPRARPFDPQDYIPPQTHVDGETIDPFSLVPWFGDPDAGDALTYSLEAALLPPGLVLDAVTGAIGGTLAADASQGGRGGVYVVPVTATDAAGASFTTNLTISVANPGPIAADDRFDADRQSIVNGDVLANNGFGADADPDGDALVVTSPTGATPGSTGGTFTIGRDGAMTFDPASDFDDLTRGETRTTSVTYTISDGEGGSAEANVTVRVGSQNGAPRLDGTPGDRTGLDGTPIEPLDVADLVEDRDGDTLDFALGPDAPDWFTIDPASGRVTGTPPADASIGGANGNGRYTVEVLVSDGIDTLRLPLVWRIGNPGPDAADDDFTTTSGTSLEGNVIAGPGADVDPDGDELVVIAPDGPVTGTRGGTFVIRPDGSMTFDPEGAFDDLGRLETRQTSLIYTVSDRQGGTSSAVATVVVQGENQAPRTEGEAAERLGTDAQAIARFDAANFFRDSDGDPLTFSLAPGAPAWLSIDPATGMVAGTPPNDASAGGEAGLYRVEVVASDGAASARLAVNWRIDNPAPSGTDDAMNVTSDRASDVYLLANDTDPDGDALRVSEIEGQAIAPGETITLPSGATLTMMSAEHMVWGPSAEMSAMRTGESVEDVFSYTLVDAQGARSEATARVLVFGTLPVPGPDRPDGPGPERPTGPEVVFPPMRPPVVTDRIDQPILTTTLGDVAPLAPRIDLDPYPPVPILTQALERAARLGGDVSLLGQPSLREALERVAAGECALSRWLALAGSAFEGHELTLGAVTFRTAVTGDVTHLDLGSFGGTGFDRWRVTGDGAGRIALIDRNIVQIERPADRDHVHLDIRARDADGRTWRVPLRVDTVHGEIRAEGKFAPIATARSPGFVDAARAALSPPALPVMDEGHVVDLSQLLDTGRFEVPVAAYAGGADRR